MTMSLAVRDLCLCWVHCDGHGSLATVAGMKEADTIISVLHSTDSTGIKFTDEVTDHCTPSATAGKMVVDVDYSSDKLQVLFHSADGSAGTTFLVPCLKCFEADGVATPFVHTVTGITAADTLIGAMHYSSGILTGQISNDYCTLGAGTVTLDTYGTTIGDKVLFFWHSADGGVGSAIDNLCIKSFKADTVTAAGTAITVTGIELLDTILAVWHYNVTGVWQADDTANCSVYAADEIKSSTTFGNDTGELIVLYHDASA